MLPRRGRGIRHRGELRLAVPFTLHIGAQTRYERETNPFKAETHPLHGVK